MPNSSVVNGLGAKTRETGEPWNKNKGRPLGSPQMQYARLRPSPSFSSASRTGSYGIEQRSSATPVTATCARAFRRRVDIMTNMQKGVIGAAIGLCNLAILLLDDRFQGVSDRKRPGSA